jgi:hypothetical protein
MKKILSVSLIAFFLILLGHVDASAQRRKSKETTQPTEEKTQDSQPAPTASTPKKTKKTDDYFDEKGGFKHRLWYGGNLILNYSGSNGQSAFTIGATPMIGYKLIGGLSAGPRIGLSFTNYKSYDTQNKVASVGTTDYTLGAFLRYKFLKTFFVHAETEYVNYQYFIPDNYGRITLDANGKAYKARFSHQNNNIGIGYNSGGLLGYEIMVLYNLTPVAGSLQQPIDMRMGFTYNF